MADVTFVQGDTAPPILGQILKGDGTPRDLADADEVWFQMRRPNWTKYQVNALATITNAAEGRVEYDWADDDLAVAASDFQAQWEIHWKAVGEAAGKIQTTTPPNTVEVRRQ